MIDRGKQCGACQNMDAYWEERARHDPELRARLMRLQRTNDLQSAPGADDGTVEPEDFDECSDECLDENSDDYSDEHLGIAGESAA